MKRKKAAKKVEPNKKASDPGKVSEEKVFDVARPGKSMPSASGRPIIVTHKPGVTDPMVAPQKTDETEKPAESPDTPSMGEGADMVMATPKKGRIEPLHTEITPDEANSDILENENTASDEELTGSIGPEAKEEAPQQDQNDEQNDEISDIASEVTTKKEAHNEAVKKETEASKKKAEIEALVTNRQFFVPINAVQKRRSMKLIVFLLVLIVLFVGFLVLWDAEVFDIGMRAPTDYL